MDLATLTAYGMRRLNKNPNPPPLPLPLFGEATRQNAIGGNAYPYENQMVTGQGEVWAQRFINTPLRPRESSVPVRVPGLDVFPPNAPSVKIGIQWHAPMGAQQTAQGRFRHFIGGRNANGGLANPEDIAEQLEVDPNMDGMVYGIGAPPMRHQYTTYTDAIACPVTFRNNIPLLFADVWRTTKAHMEGVMSPASLQDPFTCSRIEYVVAEIPGGGCSSDQQSMKHRGRTFISPRSPRSMDCLFACLRLAKER